MRVASLTTVFFLCLSSSVSALTPKEIYKQTSPAVVLILASDDGKSGSGGTGSVISADGKIITNAHVVIPHGKSNPAKILYVFLKPARLTGDNRRDLVNRYKARVLNWSPADKLDLALLQIENAPPNLPTVRFADPDKVEIGDEVAAIGFPEQGGLWTLTTGAVSTLIANYQGVNGKNVFQTEAAINRGNSGGPLFDSGGHMIGINTMIARQGAGGVAITDINFALKSSVAVKWLAGRGMGLAYATPREKKIVVAVAPEPAQQNASVSPSQGGGSVQQASSSTPSKPSKVEEAPPATIVVAEEPPKKPANIRTEGKEIGETKGKEKVTAGKPLDPKKVQPKYHTQKRPFNLDDLRRQQMKELEDMMDEMRGKIRGKKKSRGLGLW